MVKTRVKTGKNGKKVNPCGTLFSLAYAGSSGYISECYYSTVTGEETETHNRNFFTFSHVHQKFIEHLV